MVEYRVLLLTVTQQSADSLDVVFEVIGKAEPADMVATELEIQTMAHTHWMAYQ